MFVVPPVIEFFFMGGAGGVFGNRTGGVKGAILGGAINGILFIILPWVYFTACHGILAPTTSPWWTRTSCGPACWLWRQRWA